MTTDKGNNKQSGKVTKLNEGKHVFKPAQETQDSSRPSERTSEDNTGTSGSDSNSKTE